MGAIDFSVGCGPKPLVPTGPVTLAFDPAASKVEAVRRIFQDRVARNLWIGVKWRHIVSQYFNEDCLRIARALKQKPAATPEELRYRLANGQDPVFGWHPLSDKEPLELAEALFPYVCGDQDFEYVVKRDG